MTTAKKKSPPAHPGSSRRSRPGITFSHLDKVFWPEEGYTKGNVIAYYSMIAPYILPYLKGRPLSLNRHPNGIKGKNFYQKDVTREHLPPFVKTCAIYSESNKKKLRWVVCDNKETLLWLANFGCIELNPWQSNSGSLLKPDYLTIDLDPHGRSFDDVVVVALGIKKILDKAKVKSFVKTSGKSGLHIMIPLGARYSYHTARRFAELIITLTHDALPDLTTLEWRKAKRGNKIFLDIARNSKGQTTAAVYCVRPNPGATVSAPLQWSEVKKGLSPVKFTIKTIFSRLKKKGDLFKGALGKGTDLTKAIKSLQVELQKRST